MFANKQCVGQCLADIAQASDGEFDFDIFEADLGINFIELGFKQAGEGRLAIGQC